MDSQSILVLGATGGSGIAFIEEALELPNPPHLVLYIRSPSKLPQHVKSNQDVTVVTGGLSDYTALDSAMKAHRVSTVVSFLGAYVSASALVTRNMDTPIADSFPTVIQAMENNKVTRLLALSTPSYWVEDQDVGSWKLTIYGMMPKLFAPQGNAEMVRIAETVAQEASHLDWTIFRIPHLTDGPAGLPVWAGYAGPSHKGGLNLSRKSLARWVLGEILEEEWVKGAPFLGNY
ncbi:NAD(P)-binding protein [Aspergillus steynii IBT 23096]|uniref:NAD(P)-binding protein n=1 Tax=Aspergillus steynii IBT 23096 TaxID=1392250 RepID=A0A2I2G438_9EURO|nr:NAD(P)-binding protein [Aspergillus steynii IBT 23096]PLB47631.1 NAD(P)-binding protein [Aspergillus steynii IBT 23096]